MEESKFEIRVWISAMSFSEKKEDFSKSNKELKEKITDTKIDLAKADVDLERYKDEKASKEIRESQKSRL